MPMSDESGQELIRRALYARNRRHNLAALARDVGVPSTALEVFITGSGSLTPDVLKALAVYAWGNSEYDPQTDRIRPARKEEPKSLGERVQPMENWQLPQFPAWNAPDPYRGPVKVRDAVLDIGKNDIAMNRAADAPRK